MGKYALEKILMSLLEQCKQWANMVQSQYLKSEGVAVIPENILPEFSFVLLEGRYNVINK